VTETGIRVALADDDVLLREGLASLLEQSGLSWSASAVMGRSSSRWSGSMSRNWPS
jgi:hypothetical protein